MEFRIDPKYFNRFAWILGIVSVLILAISTIYLHNNAKDNFYKRVKKDQNHVKQVYMKCVFKDDSMRVVDYRNKFVVLDFWGTYASPSKSLFENLSKFQHEYPDKLTVLAACVRNARPTIAKFLKKNGPYPFHFVYGDKLFFHLKVPGVPTIVVYKPDGKLLYVHAGYRNSSALKILKQNLRKQ